MSGSAPKTFFGNDAIKQQQDRVRQLISGSQELNAEQRTTLLGDLTNEINTAPADKYSEFGFQGFSDTIQKRIGDVAKENALRRTAVSESLTAQQQAVNPRLQNSVANAFIGATTNKAARGSIK